jgi:hypothetical protein
VLWQFSLKAVQVLDQGRGDRIRSESGANVRESNRAACAASGLLVIADPMRPQVLGLIPKTPGYVNLKGPAVP